MYSKSDKRNKGTGHFLNIESSWEPDTLNLVSMAFGGYAYSLDQRGVTNQWMNDAAGQRLYSFDIANRIPRTSYYSFDGHLDYQHKTHVKDETLTLSYIVSTSRTHTRSEYDYFNQENAPMSYTGYDTRNKENFLEHTFQFDWTRPFAKYHKIETGVKYIHRSNKSHTTMDYAGLDPITCIPYDLSHGSILNQRFCYYACSSCIRWQLQRQHSHHAFSSSRDLARACYDPHDYPGLPTHF